MKFDLRIVFAVAVVGAVGVLALHSTPASAQAGRYRYRSHAMSGISSNPLYDEQGGSGQNPLYEPKTRYAFGGVGPYSDQSPAVAYGIDVLVILDQNDSRASIRKEGLVHRDIAARSAQVQTVDVFPTPDGVLVSFNGGTPEKLSFKIQGDMPARISTNVTVTRQTQGATFGEKMTIQTFGNKGEVLSFDSVPFN